MRLQCEPNSGKHFVHSELVAVLVGCVCNWCVVRVQVGKCVSLGWLYIEAYLFTGGPYKNWIVEAIVKTSGSFESWVLCLRSCVEVETISGGREPRKNSGDSLRDGGLDYGGRL